MGTRISFNDDYSHTPVEKHRLIWESTKFQKDDGDNVKAIHDKPKINTSFCYRNEKTKFRETIS